MPESSSRSSAALFRLCLSCELNSVRAAAEQAREFLASRGAPSEILLGCELALVEACNNAILYAPAAARDRPVEILLLCDGADLEMQVLDHTSGFVMPAHAQLPDPDAEHGRGLFIIRSVMDEATYLRGEGENRFVLRKRNLFPNYGPNARTTSPLEQAQEKLALTEQVINKMAQELYTQITTSRAKQEEWDSRLLARELEIARNIQHSLLPKVFPSLPGYSLAGFCLSARQVGGDFYDLLPLSPDTALLAVADVMGKGVPAALFAATLRTLLRTTVQWIRHPAMLLRHINRLMFEDLSGVDMFITAQLALVDTRVGRLLVASAGHCPLLVATEQGLETVCPEGMPLGIVPDIYFEEEAVPLAADSCLLMYTDGLTETRNASSELFGQARLHQWFREVLSQRRCAANLADAMQAELKKFEAGVAPVDDQTFLVLAPASQSAGSSERNLAVPSSAQELLALSPG